MSVTPTALPPPAIDPGDVQLVLPSLSPEQAALAAQLATAALQAALWPNPIPEPIPPPVYAVLLQVATRFGIAIEQGTASPVVSESIGSYSYRLATPQGWGGAFGLSDDDLAALAPWMGRAGVYDVSIVGGVSDWPPDWWQRNLEQGGDVLPTPVDGGAIRVRP